MARLPLPFGRIRDIFKTKGITGLVRISSGYLLSKFIQYDKLYLYEHDLVGWNETNYLPRIPNIECEIIRNKNETNRTLPEYLDTYRINADIKFEKGAIAVCLFAGAELVHISWMAITPTARQCCDKLPYQVKFSEKQACTGGSYTNPKFRGQNLMTYANYKKFQYLKEIGITSIRHCTSTSNISSQKAYVKFGQKLYAKATYLRIFGFKYWRERPAA